MELSLGKNFKPAVRQLTHTGSHWTVPISIILVLGLWKGATLWGGFPAFILPAPERVWQRFLLALADGSLLRNTSATLLEFLAGLLTGVILATLTRYLMA